MQPPRLAVLILALLAAGCGFHLQGRGTFLPADIRSIGVPPFQNRTARPELAERITSEILLELQVRSGRRTAAAAEGVDAILRGEVVSWQSLPLEVNPDGRARTIQVVVAARARLVDATDEAVIWAADHFVFRQAYPVGDEAAEFIDTEGLALDEVAADFAEAVVTSMLEGF